jgi:hypothetical protein
VWKTSYETIAAVAVIVAVGAVAAAVIRVWEQARAERPIELRIEWEEVEIQSDPYQTSLFQAQPNTFGRN